MTSPQPLRDGMPVVLAGRARLRRTYSDSGRTEFVPAMQFIDGTAEPRTNLRPGCAKNADDRPFRLNMGRGAIPPYPAVKSVRRRTIARWHDRGLPCR